MYRYHPAPTGSSPEAVDTLIAAHALALGAVLVTDNLREFRRVPELSVETWG
jgi:tRNA(fMet)-specific endonuclease VapC